MLANAGIWLALSSLAAACSAPPAPTSGPAPEPVVPEPAVAPEPDAAPGPSEPASLPPEPDTLAVAKSHPAAVHLRVDPENAGEQIVTLEGVSVKVAHDLEKVVVSSPGGVALATYSEPHAVVLEIFVEPPHVWIIGFVHDGTRVTRTVGQRFTSADLKQAGGFEGEGVVDYNTIDLDER